MDLTRARNDKDQPWHTREELQVALHDVEIKIEDLLGSMHAVEEASSDSISVEWSDLQTYLGDIILKTCDNLPDRTRRAAGLTVI